MIQTSSTASAGNLTTRWATRRRLQQDPPALSMLRSPRLPAPRGARHQRSSALPRASASAGEQPAGTVLREALSSEGRTKLDATPDADFYAFPRFTTHVDDAFLRQLTQLYRERLPAGGVVLDLGASHLSHLPPDVMYSRVVGQGMNTLELAANRRLHDHWTQDFNADASPWPLDDQSVDAVVSCVSVQYWAQPERVFAEALRVLKPGGVCIIAFSSRMFYAKAVAAWREGTGYSRAQLVKSYFGAVAGWTQPEAVTAVGAAPDNSLLGRLAQMLQRGAGDPFYAIIAYRNFRPQA